MPQSPKNFLRNKILQILDAHGPSTVREVYIELSARHPVSVTTVATVMNRLVAQHLLARQGKIRHYQYSLLPPDFAVSARTKHSLESLFSELGEAGMAYFVDALDAVNPQALDEIEAIVRARKEAKFHE
jgi:predicted transcriptional regulator